MAFQKAEAVTLTAASGADIAQARLVTIGASGLTLAADNGDAIGVTAEAYDDSAFTEDAGSNAIPVIIEGICEIEAGEAVAVGDQVTPDAQGRATTAATGNVVIGICVAAAGAAGEFADVLLVKGGGTAA